MIILKSGNSRKNNKILLVFAALIVMSLLYGWFLSESIAADGPEYEEYVESMSRSVSEGSYLIMPFGSDMYCLGVESDRSGSEICLILTDPEAEQRIHPIFSEGTYILKFFGTDLVIDVSGGEYSTDSFIQANTRTDASEQLWKIMEADDADGYYITSSDETWALACDPEEQRVFLSEFAYSDEQKWILEQ